MQIKPSLETIAGLYAAARNQGPLAVARVMESAARWGYSVAQLEGAVAREGRAA